MRDKQHSFPLQVHPRLKDVENGVSTEHSLIFVFLSNKVKKNQV